MKPLENAATEPGTADTTPGGTAGNDDAPEEFGPMHESAALDILVSCAVTILFRILILCFCALLGASLSIARHLRVSYRGSRQAFPRAPGPRNGSSRLHPR